MCECGGQAHIRTETFLYLICERSRRAYIKFFIQCSNVVVFFLLCAINKLVVEKDFCFISVLLKETQLILVRLKVEPVNSFYGYNVVSSVSREWGNCARKV